MSQDRFKFKLEGISIIEDNVNIEKVKEYLTEKKSQSIINSLEIGLAYEPDSDLMFIKVGFTYKKENEVPFARIVIENKYSIFNLKNHVVVDNKTNEFKLKNRGFLLFLVDNSIAHLRAIQALKLSPHTSKIPFLPFNPASKLLVNKNKVSDDGKS